MSRAVVVGSRVGEDEGCGCGVVVGLVVVVRVDVNVARSASGKEGGLSRVMAVRKSALEVVVRLGEHGGETRVEVKRGSGLRWQHNLHENSPGQVPVHAQRG